MKKLLALILVIGITPVANALMVRLSLDGVNPVPEAIDVTPAEIIAMYVISDSDGVGYEKQLDTAYNNPGIISNVQSYPAAGDYASITDLSGSLRSRFLLEAAGENIEAGKHFSFDLTIAPDAAPGTEGYIYLATPAETNSLLVNVVPEPGTVLLLGLGGLTLLRKRKA